MGFIFKSKKEKQEDKELEEYLDKYDKLEQELDKDKENKFNIMQLFEKDPNDELLRQYMTKEQLEEEENDKKNNKRFLIIASSIFGIALVAFIVVIILLNYSVKDELHKNTIKEFKNYYNNKYGTHTSVEDIDYLCFVNSERQKECTDIIYAHTKDGKVIMRKGEEYGDNNGTSGIYKEYKEEIASIIGPENFIYDNPLISYKDFYYAYYQYTDYINVLPNKSYKELIDSKKTTLRDFIIYQNDININTLVSFLSNYTDESEIVILKTNKGMPINLTVVHKNGYYSINILSENKIDDGITYYQLDTNYNNTSSVKISKVSTTSITPLKKESSLSNTITITAEQSRSTSNDEIDRSVLPSYYLLAFDNLNENIIQFNGNSELNKEEYSYMQTINISNKTYLLASSNISIGNISYSKK